MRDGNSGGATGDAWLVWGFLGFLFILATFHRSSMSVLADRLMADLGASAASFGAITSAYFYVYMLMQVPSGALADTLGPRLLVAGGLAISAAGCFLLSAAGSVPTALAGRLLIGLGVSGIFVSTLKVQAERFPPSTFATLSGLATVMGNIGNLAATVPFAVVVNAVGWRRPFVAIGLLSAFCAVAAWLVLRPKRVNGPTGSGGTGDRPPVRKALAAVLRNPATWPPLLANFGLYGTYLAFTSMWGVPYLMTTYGLPRAAAAARLVYGIAGFALGGPALGLLSDRVFRRRRAVYAGVALFTLATWSIIALGGARPPLKAWGPLLFAMGFGYGSMTLALANIKEVNPGEAAGIATSLANTGGFLGAALLQPAFGFLLDRHWQGDLTASGARAYPPDAYAVLFQVSAALIFVSFLATLFLREMPTEREAGSPRLAAGAP